MTSPGYGRPPGTGPPVVNETQNCSEGGPLPWGAIVS
jgi:hypothetical protein